MATLTAVAPQPRVADRRKQIDIEAYVCFGVAFAVALLYSIIVGHIWEDYFITFRHSENLCNGHGLVYNVDDRLHGFTSPIGTLLPALCHLVTGQTSFEPALWLFRIISISAFAGGCVFLWKSSSAAHPHFRFSGIIMVALYVLDAKAVEFTTDGQETGFMLFFLAWGVYLLTSGVADRWLACGICWTGLMWTRPDGCVYVAALGLAGLIFANGPRSRTQVAMLKAAAICAVLYLPWFLWAWSYYGSPVPHTVVAKSYLYAGVFDQLKGFSVYVFDKFPTVASAVFLPAYETGEVWFTGQDWSQWFLMSSGKYLALFSAFYWLVPVNDRLGRTASFCFFFACLYLSSLNSMFPWYLPPAGIFALIVLGRACFTLAHVASSWFPNDVVYRRGAPIATIVLGFILLRQLALFGLVGYQMRIQQVVIEMGHRREVGEWLKQEMQPRDRVMLEPFGYIGYFSGGHIMDWPGLVSREVVEVRKRGKPGNERWFPDVANELKPEWLVLRPQDIESMREQPFFKNYSLARVFDANPKLDVYALAPGQGWLRYDAKFFVFKKH